MGLIRKTLAVSSLGLVRGESKKQRVARRTMQATESTASETRASLTDFDTLAQYAVSIGVPQENIDTIVQMRDQGHYSHGQVVDFLNGWTRRQEQQNARAAKRARKNAQAAG